MFRQYLCVILLLFAVHQVAARLPGWLQDEVYRLQWSPFQTKLIKDCSTDDYILDIKDITLIPEQPVPGEDLLIQAVGYLKEPVDFGASAHVRVKMGLVQLLSHSYDICQELKGNNAELQCPISEGLVTVTQKVTLPKEIPRTHFRVEVRAENFDKKPLACLDIAVSFRNHRSIFKNRLLTEW